MSFPINHRRLATRPSFTLRTKPRRKKKKTENE
jgi:hypothetical protein